MQNYEPSLRTDYASSINTSIRSTSPSPSEISTTVSTIRDGAVTPTLSVTSTQTEQPPPYSIIDFDRNSHLTAQSQDPRSSSTQSLIPEPHQDQRNKRTLLLVYIHGFMGDEASFQSFPFHVHNLTTALLSRTHVVHTKIYPKYRSKNRIEVAVGNLSDWLKPHENGHTDIVLLGHSMGGILAADVAMLKPKSPSDARQFRHNILGTVNFDVPFLGFRPGVIKSGLSSLFNPATTPAPPKDELALNNGSQLSIHRNSPPPLVHSQSDPNYNPAYANDVRLPRRSGWASALHFVNKHQKNIRGATQKLITSHWDFARALSEPDELYRRYTRIRILEDSNDNMRKSIFRTRNTPPRIRFVNYYTAASGRPKKPKHDRKHSKSHSTREEPQDGDRRTIRRSVSSSSMSSSDFSDSTQSSSTSSGTSSSDTITRRNSLDEPTSSNTLVDARTVTDTEAGTTSEPDLSSVTSGPSRTTTSLSSLSSMSGSIGPPPERPVAPPLLPPVDWSTCSRHSKAWRDFCKAQHAQHRRYGHELRDYYKQMKKYKQASIKEINSRKTSVEDVEQGRAEDLSPDDSASQTRGSDLGSLSPSSNNEMGCPRSMSRKQSSNRMRRLEEEKARLRAEIEEAYRNDVKEVKETWNARKAQLHTEWKRAWTQKRLEQRRTRAEKKDERRRKSEIRSATMKNKFGRNPSLGITTFATSEDATSTPNENEMTGEELVEEPLEMDDVDDTASQVTSRLAEKVPIKERAFCTLPSPDSRGNPDAVWHKIFLNGVDEVGAHSALFFTTLKDEPVEAPYDWSLRYTEFVVSVSEMLESWISEDMTERLGRDVKALP